MEAKLDQMQRAICSRIELKSGFAEPHQKARQLETMFRQLDANGSGQMDINEFYGALGKLNFGDDSAVVDAFFARFDVDGSGSLSYREFAEGLFGVRMLPAASSDCRTAIAAVKRKLAENGGATSLRTLTRTLRRMDMNGNGHLDRTELQEGLAECGVRLTNKDLDTVFLFFDTDRSGSVTVAELMTALRGPLPPARRALVKEAYARLDKDGSGRVTLADMQAAYETPGHPAVKAGIMTPDEVLQEFMAGWDSDGDHIVTFDEFAEYYRDLSACIDTDQYFELMMRNAWHISGGEGSSANTTCRRVLVTHFDGSQTIEEIKDDLGIHASETERLRANLFRQGIRDIRCMQIIGAD